LWQVEELKLMIKLGRKEKKIMKFLGVIIIFCLATIIQTIGGVVFAQEKGRYGQEIPGPNEVRIGGMGVVIPLGRILLIRRGLEYGAVKFTEAWTGKTGKEWHANYESYYQGDKSGDFSKKNVQFRRGKVIQTEGIFFGGHSWSLRTNIDIRCGPIRLAWSYKTFLSFRPSGKDPADYGIELSPTKWTDISEVNVFDQRLKWYRYDEKRDKFRIPIDQLWEDNEKK